ncbi:hypothetical protein C0993_005013 [Termitomyces sp. T159_Od127]|nr:hypothetical protein C0993_005013 [Termitomyces sp. T159_Od127]
MSTLNHRPEIQSGDFSSGGLKSKDYNISYFNPLSGHKPDEMSHSHTKLSYEGTENNARRSEGVPGPIIIPNPTVRSESTQRKLTRSKTISRLLSLKSLVRSRTTASNTSQPLFRSPTRITSAFGSKETRDAALRERGLLPPSKLNVDLSLVERERDRHLPVLMPPLDEEVDADDGQGSKMSAAAKVKQEWETKHRDDKGLERMKNSTIRDLASSPMKDVLSPTVVRSSASLEPFTCCETNNLSQIAPTSASSSTPLKHLSKNLEYIDFSTESQPFFSSPEPYITPLPPSPSPSSLLNSQEELLIHSLSPSPSSESSTSPAIYRNIPITPPVIPPLHDPTGPDSSLLTPVFHSASPVMTAPHVTSITTSPDLLENDDILMTESPIETPLTGSISGRPRDSGNFEVTLAPDISAAGSTDLSKTRPRNFTDPTGFRIHQVEPCKSSSYPFKRYTDPPLSTDSTRRLSIRASFNNLRRSLVGTLSRAKTAGLDKGFNSPHLLPSPTFPVPGIDQAGVDQAACLNLSQTQSPACPESRKVRLSVSPTLYSRGTILAETNNIKDEESRRMTELAFLG